jgi:hypothetical protein
MRIQNLIIASVLSLSLPALAEEAPPETPAAPATDVKAEVKAATGIADRMPTGEAESFPDKSTVYVWSQVTGAGGQTVEHVWKRDGQEIRRNKFSIGSKRWRFNSRLTRAAKGSYVVEVVLGDQVLGDVKFTVE